MSDASLHHINNTRYDWEDARNVEVPFELALKSGKILQCQQILRTLPGKRLVCVASLENELILIKLFMGNKQQLDANKDAQGVKALMAAGISTPTLIDEDVVKDKSYPVLLFQYLPNTVSFRAAWDNSSDEEREPLIAFFVEMIAHQHNAGLTQGDFHTDNFLFDSQLKLYAIDGGDYLISSHPVGKLPSQANLAMLFAHLPWSVLRDQKQLINDYLDIRNWKQNPVFFKQLLNKSDKLRKKRARLIAKKAFRSCSEFDVWKKGNLRIYQRRDIGRETIEKWIATTELNISEEKDQLIKLGNSQTVWKTDIGNQKAVVKRYNIKNVLHALKRIFTRSRASKSWENAHRLRAYHIKTPTPLFMVEERKYFLRSKSWFVSEYQQGKSALGFFDIAQQSSIIKALADLVKAFANNKLVHGDMKASNFIVDGEVIKVIDLDSMSDSRFYPFVIYGIWSDKRRFLENWQDKKLRKIFAGFFNY